MAVLWGLIALVGVVAYYASDLPPVDDLAAPHTQPGIAVLAADGTMIAAYGRLKGDIVEVADLPPSLIEAVLATEDRRFYEHGGIDPRGLARAMVTNIMAGGVVQGGSTITQQLAKLLFLTPERSLKRKAQEALLALWLERRYTKDEILSLYLNRAYFGAGAYGVDAAARRYFDRSARDLTLSQSAMIAGLLKAPSRYAPTNNPDLAEKRMRTVLSNMVEAGYLKSADIDGVAAPRVAPSGQAAVKANDRRYFTDWVRERVSDYVGTVDEDLVVRTTLNLDIQRAAEDAVRKALTAEGEKRRVEQAALLALSPEGAVRAMVGGRSYLDSQFNRAVQARRQSGSVFKLFVYLAALEAGMGPRTVVEDAPVTVDGWSPTNYEDSFSGPVTLRHALARSINTVAVRVAEKVGRDRVLQMARRLGLSGDLPAGPSVSLGSGATTLDEMTSAYAVLANKGAAVRLFGVEEIATRSGRVLYHRAAPDDNRVLDPRTAATMTDMLKTVVDQGTGRAARFGVAAAGKTGTSQDFRDAWFVGFTGSLVAGVWVGNDDNSPMRGVTGGRLPAAIWREFMTEARPFVAARPLPDLATVSAPDGGGRLRDLLESILGGGGQESGGASAPARPRAREPRQVPDYPGQQRFDP